MSAAAGDPEKKNPMHKRAHKSNTNHVKKLREADLYVRS